MATTIFNLSVLIMNFSSTFIITESKGCFVQGPAEKKP
jgi:hypothetical protein